MAHFSYFYIRYKYLLFSVISKRKDIIPQGFVSADICVKDSL